MTDSTDFKTDLHARLTALTEPTPTATRDFVAAVRDITARRRRRVRTTAAAVTVVFAVGLGAAAEQFPYHPDPAQSGSAVLASDHLLRWPTRTSGSGPFDLSAITVAWPGRHTAVHLLYAGVLSHDQQVAVVEGQTDTGEARTAVLTRGSSGWRLGLDVPAFDTPPDLLLLVLDTGGGPATIVLIAAPDAAPARINTGEGSAVTFMTAGSVQHLAVAQATKDDLRLYVTDPSRGLEERSLRRWVDQDDHGMRLTLIVPGPRKG